MHTKNIERARRIWSQVENYPDGFDFRVLADIYTEKHIKESVDEDALRDVLADMMHLCELTGLPFDEVLTVARKNYERERDGHEQG